MTRAMAFVGLTLLAAGCGGSSPATEGPAAGPAAATGKPAADETKACIAAYMAECGWKDVEFVSLADRPELPRGAAVVGDAWAYSFTARYTDVFGERQASTDWVAVVARADGKPCLKCCFDATGQLVGGHRGVEGTETAVLTHQPGTGGEYPIIVAPKP
jgi:hypothetical protein